MSVSALIVTRSLKEVLPETVKGLKTYPFDKIIVVSKRSGIKPDWCDLLILEKGKLGKARNVGVEVIDSMFVCMVDADIIIPKGYIEALLEYFREHSVVAVGGRLKSLRKSFYSLVKEQLFRGYCKVHADLPCGGTIYRTNILKKEGFNEDLAGGEDHELHTRLKRKGYKIIYVNDLMCYHDFKGDVRKEIYACLRTGAEIKLTSALARTLASPIRGLIYMLACRDNLYSLFVPLFYITQWIAHLIGSVFYSNTKLLSLKY